MTELISVGDKGLHWLEKILAQKHHERVRAAANIVYHAGVIVLQMRGLRDRMKEVLGALRGFNPVDWSHERRAARISDLRSFAYDLPVFGIMTQHAMTLRELDEVKPDEEVAKLRDRIVALTLNVTHVGAAGSMERARSSELSWYAEIAEYYQKGLEEEGEGIVQGGPDLLIQEYLPALLWLVRHADSDHPEQIRTLRALAHDLLVTRSNTGDQKLEDVVQEAEITFGKLTGRLLAKYPDLPSPTWAGGRTA